MSIFDKFFKKEGVQVNTVTAPNTVVSPPGSGNFSTFNLTAASPVFSPMTITTAPPGQLIGNLTGAAGSGGNFVFQTPQPNHIIQFSAQGKEVVRLNIDGSVTWNGEINIDEAAEAFAKSIAIGAELCAGLTKKVKAEMRDVVFKEIIAIAKEKGNLTAEDLTYLFEASKIIEKLKGRNE